MPEVFTAVKPFARSIITSLFLLVLITHHQPAAARELQGSNQKKSPEKPRVMSAEEAEMIKQTEEMMRQAKEMLEQMKKDPGGKLRGSLPMPQLTGDMASLASGKWMPPRDEARLTSLPKGVMSAAERDRYTRGLFENLKKRISSAAAAKAEKTIGSSNNPEAMNLTAVALWYANDRETALFIAAKAAATHPSYKPVQNTLASFLHLSGYPEKAIPLLQSLMAESAENSTLMNNLGQAYLSLGDKENGKRLLMGCIARSPQHPEANCSLARLYESEGNTAKAVEHFQSAVKSVYSNFAANALQRLKAKPSAGKLAMAKYKKLKEYFNPFKYQLPQQVESVDQWESLRGSIEEKAAQFKAANTEYFNKSAEFARANDEINKKRFAGGKSVLMPLSRRMQAASRIYNELGLEQHNLFIEGRNKWDKQIIPALKGMKTEYDLRLDKLDKKYMTMLAKIPDGEGSTEADGAAHAALTKEWCSMKDDLANEYLLRHAAAINDHKDSFIPQYAPLMNDLMAWGLVADESPLAETHFYQHASSYMGELNRILASYATVGDSGAVTYKVCTKHEPPKEKKGETEKLDTKCPLPDLSVTIKIATISLTCDAFRITVGMDNMSVEYEKALINGGYLGETTMSINIGISTEQSLDKTRIPDIETITTILQSNSEFKAEASEKFFVKWDKNNSFSDIGMKVDVSGSAKATILGKEVEFKDHGSMTIGLNSGLEIEPGTILTSAGKALF